MRTALHLSPDDIVKDGVANSRLEGIEVSDETREVMRRLSTGEMSVEEFEAWEDEQAEIVKSTPATRSRAFG